MNIFEMSGTIDLNCLNISSSSSEMAAPTKRGFGKGYGRIESIIEGVVESPPKMAIYIDTSCYIDKTIEMTCGDIYSQFSRKDIP